MKQKIVTGFVHGKSRWMAQSAPWLAGAGLALGHFATTSTCTLPQQGRCSTCGSCIVALGALVGWAVLKKSKEEDLYHSK